MTKITVGSDLRRQLAGALDPVELCDEDGYILGVFRPATGREMYKGVDAPHTEEELDRREGVTETYSTAEVLKRLESL
jgi:hypothetical protein